MDVLAFHRIHVLRICCPCDFEDRGTGTITSSKVRKSDIDAAYTYLYGKSCSCTFSSMLLLTPESHYNSPILLKTALLHMTKTEWEF